MLVVIIYSIIWLISLRLGYRVIKNHSTIDIHNAHLYVPFINRIGIVVSLLVVLLLIALKFDTLAQYLFYTLQNNMVFLIWFILGLFLFFLSGYALFIAIKRQKIRFSVFIVVTDIFFLYLYHNYNTPVYHHIMARDSNEIYMQQSSLYSCAPTSFAMIAKTYGLKLNEREATRLMGTTKFGTTAGQIRFTLDQLGFRFSMLNQQYSTLDQIDTKAILFIDRQGGYENHSVAYFGKVGDRYQLFDPMDGIRLLSSKEVERIWHGNGIKISQSIDKK